MNRTILYLWVLLLTFCSSELLAQDTPCYEQKISFQAEEELQYKISYNWKALWMGAGTVDFSIKEESLNGQPVYHTKAIGKTFKRYEWFYKVYDVYESYLDTNSLKPVRFVRDINEGGFTKNIAYDFEFDNNQAHIDYMYRKDELQKQNEYTPINFCTFDMLSSVYYTRNINYDLLAPNDTIPVEVLMDGQVYPLYMIYLGKENLKTSFGTFRCLKIKPSLMDGDIFEGGDFMTIWATDDDNRLPLLIESPLKVGYVKAVLKEHKNLKYPMEARVD